MSEKPILFSGPMVKALLAGTKTQTRRIVKPQPDWNANGGGWYPPSELIGPEGQPKRARHYGNAAHVAKGFALDFSPYGVPGDRLWVREGWQVIRDYDAFDAPRIWIASAGDMQGCVHYPADSKPAPDWVGRKRLARFMPRWASRITLEITDVRVERLQEISGSDARAEGVTTDCERKSGDYHGDMARHLTHVTGQCHVEAYERLWDSINGKRAPWSSNPWVWVVSFRRVSA